MTIHNLRITIHESLVTSHLSLYCMRIREYTPADFDALRQLHAAQGFGYPLPDLDSPLFVTKLILEEEEEDSDEWRTEDQDAEGRELANRNSPPEESCPSEKAPCRSSSTRILMAVLLRLTAETYLLHDPAAGTPRQRWQRFLAIHEAALCAAAACGLDDAQAFLPPPIARSFGRRLARLGWKRDPWLCFSKVIGD